MSLNRDRKAGTKPGNGWVRDRKKFGAGPPVQYPFSREKDPFDDGEGEDSADGESFGQDLPETEDSSGENGAAAGSAAGEEIPEEDFAAAGSPSVEEDSAEDFPDLPGAGEDMNSAGASPEKGYVYDRTSGPEKAGESPDASDGTHGSEGIGESPDAFAAEQDEEKKGEIENSGRRGLLSGPSLSVPAIVGAGNEKIAGSVDRIRRSMTKKRVEMIRMVIRTAAAGFFAILFLMPIVLTITNSFMTSSEISANYGMIFAKSNGVRVFISKTVNLKFIPDIISFDQYFKVLFLSPEYLMKFWNSFFYVVPIVVFQLAVASLASYGFARYRGRVREIIFFSYIILMLMPYQVTLVPNYLVSTWLNIIDTRWAILLPGFFSPFAVYMLTKYMRRIPRSLYEAAEIDGAGEWQIFTRVCLPNCRGGLASIAILIFIDYWNMVEQPLILLSDDQLHPLSVFLSRINSGEISLAFAVAVIYMVLPMMVFLYGEDYLVEGIIYQGGIKE